MTPDELPERDEPPIGVLLHHLGAVAYTVRLHPDLDIEFLSDNVGAVLGIEVGQVLAARTWPTVRSQDGHLLQQLLSAPRGSQHEFVLSIRGGSGRDVATSHWARTRLRSDGSVALDGIMRVLPDVPAGFDSDATDTLQSMIDELARSKVPERKVGVLSIAVGGLPIDLEGLVTQRLRHAVRGDDVVVRVGDTRYVVLVGRLRNALNALDVANVVLDDLLRPVGPAGAGVQPTASIGVALAAIGTDARAAIERSLAAFGTATDLGGNRVSVHHADVDIDTGLD